MLNWIDAVAFIPVLIAIFLSFKYLVLKKQNAGLAILYIQSEADKDLLKKQILQAIEDKKLVESEEFMMFLSKSREAAFEYIEDAQAAILKFNNTIFDAQIEGADSNDVLTRILDANKELQKLLPDNIKNNNVQGEL